jgi:hypothetical protein
MLFPANKSDKIEKTPPYDLSFPKDQSEYPGRLRFTIMSNEEQQNFAKNGSGVFINSGEEKALITPQSMPIASITLPLPSGLNFQDKVDYGQGATGSALTGGITAALRQGGDGIIDALKTAATDQFNSLKSGPKDGGALLATRVAGTFGGEIEAATKSVTRVSVNPNFRTLFNNVPIRGFQFSFTMIPKSQDETIEIQRIINAFRTELYPKRLFASGDFSIGYKFPNTFRIQGFIGTKKIPHGFLPCFLTDVNLTYNADNKGFHADDTFTTYQMDLTFMEVRALSRDDVEGETMKDDEENVTRIEGGF